MKRKTTTQKNYLIFYLATKEKQFAKWRSRKWNTTKKYYDALFGIFDFYHNKANEILGTSLKNPRSLEVMEFKQKFNRICDLMRLKHIIITQRNKRSKCQYAPNVHRDISFNQNLVSRFGTAE